MTAAKDAPDPWMATLLPQFLDLTANRQIEIEHARSTLESGLKAGQDPLPPTREIGQIAHKIAGTAASFGFAGLGRQAQLIEGLCAQIGKLPAPARAKAVRGSLIPALDALTQELDLALVAAP